MFAGYSIWYLKTKYFPLGLSTKEEVKLGVQHILADMIYKDKETKDFIRNL